MSIAPQTVDHPSDVQHSNSERRRGLRIHQNRPVKVFDALSSRYLPGRTRDISSTGLQLELPVSAPILAGRMIHVHVGLDGGGGALVNRRGMLPVRVVWVRRDPMTTMLTAGVELVAGTGAQLGSQVDAA